MEGHALWMEMEMEMSSAHAQRDMKDVSAQVSNLSKRSNISNIKINKGRYLHYSFCEVYLSG